MKLPRKRKARFAQTLIYADEPQLILLKDKGVHLVALAVPSEDEANAMFVATTVTRRDWQAYLDGNYDLRYLFTYPKQRIVYTFDLAKMSDSVVTMDPLIGAIPEEYLPEPRLFSIFHTEEVPVEPLAEDEEVLVVDGEWDMPEFGSFYQRYSDVYAFLAALKNWNDSGLAQDLKRKILDTFRTKPFQGGFSYVHFFQELNEQLQRIQRLGLEKISYASPGTVEIRGQAELFADVKTIVPHFLDNRDEISKQYNKLHRYLSENKFLAMSGENYPDEPAVSRYINHEAKLLTELMAEPHFETVAALANKNALVTAKIVMSFYRRLDDATAYFAQGRVSFSG
ncbi:hypothetical protein GOA77_25200 [Sinorhizobium meliloti]|uniref:hypothetical protein n=1 Tax=Rhizobium meliloti TaxID=382 RepID=UPI000FD24782|nr:hypothetical protein [Sinorhizobium meliloti]MDW9408159.1 hypothetical protein [Sinorhizobium meliloti]MDW9466117.1 hypothetical protein [Sinorhizobium meliloti]MDW9500427.1 hypothetical protein [Sinorhizobium meliloti]MDW9722152.1 hypothetical protein [Sinorhizobium meliloti]MDW9731380.1 hypothetical protein [Sinorhizobium meliloti]